MAAAYRQDTCRRRVATRTEPRVACARPAWFGAGQRLIEATKAQINARLAAEPERRRQHAFGLRRIHHQLLAQRKVASVTGIEVEREYPGRVWPFQRAQVPADPRFAEGSAMPVVSLIEFSPSARPYRADGSAPTCGSAGLSAAAGARKRRRVRHRLRQDRANP